LRNSSDPKRLLKFISPQESQLVDAAAGIHIKFRLGGVSFPPTIYYKIFVHNPLIDMNSFSPRNYINECKQALPTLLFNKTASLPNSHHGTFFS
jgi:hypothetical protein